MSELKVNEISGLGGTVSIKGQVGIPTIVGSNKLTVDGNIQTQGSIEVTTVSAQSFGVNIKGSQTPSTGDSILKFTSYANDDRASIVAKNNKSLVLSTNGTERVTIDSTGTVINNFKSEFIGDSLFKNNCIFENAILFNSDVNFSSTSIPKCAGIPSTPYQLVNLDFLQKNSSKIQIEYRNKTTTALSQQTINPANIFTNIVPGSYTFLSFVTASMNDSFVSANISPTITLSLMDGSSVVAGTSHNFTWVKNSDIYSKSMCETAGINFVIGSSRNLNVKFDITNNQTGLSLSTSYVCMLIKL